MKLEKHMVDEGLQPMFTSMKWVASLIRTKWGVTLINRLTGLAAGKKIPGIQSDEHYIPGEHDAPPLRVRVFTPKDASGPLPALFYFHGGGYILGNPEIALDIIKRFIDTRPCIVIAPDYRKAMKHPYPAAFNDCYNTLLWAKQNAGTLGIIPEKFIVAGHSAGGGLTAAVTLKARDTREVDIAFQMPIYPMIDDRQATASSQITEAPNWDARNNAFAWNLYLKSLHETGAPIPAYAAPARNEDYSSFPPTITFVGDLEPFRDETIAYAEALQKAGVPNTFRIFKRCFHGFDIVGDKAPIAREAIGFTYQSFAEYYDTYVK